MTTLLQMFSSLLNLNRTTVTDIRIGGASCYTPSEPSFGTWQKGMAQDLGDRGGF